jgi:hypothetical protein
MFINVIIIIIIIINTVLNTWAQVREAGGGGEHRPEEAVGQQPG